MLTILVSWIIASVVSLAFGKLLISIFARWSVNDSGKAYNLSDIFFIGVCFIGFILSAISLWFPLGKYLVVGFFLLSLAYLAYDYLKNKEKSLFPYVIRLLKDTPLFYKILIAGSALAIMIFALLPLYTYDTFLYHLQTMMWMEAFPVIPGLANIHGRFGFNSNSLLIHSLFSFTDFFKFRVFGLSSLSMLFLYAWIARRFIRERFVVKTGLVVFCAVFFWGYIDFISSPSPDFLTNVIVAYILLRALLDFPEMKRLPLLSVFLPVFCVTLKLSAAPICLLSLIVLIDMIKLTEYKKVLVWFSFGTVIFAIWCIRNIIITGYLVYPFPAIDLFSFDWKVPINMVEEEKAWISSWARRQDKHHSEVLNSPFWEWGKPWIKRYLVFYKITFICIFMALLSPLTMLGSYILNKSMFRKRITVFYVWLIALSGTFFWFVMAPDARFAFGFIVITAILPFLVWDFEPKKTVMLKLPSILFVLFIFSFLFKGVRFNDVGRKGKPVISYLYRSQSIDSRKPEEYFAAGGFKEFKLNDIVVYVPTFSDQCYDHPFPCTPSFNKNLEMRGETMREGFRVKK